MRAFTCTVLFALSSVAYADETPGSEADPADDHADANDPGTEEGGPDASPEDGETDAPDGNAEPETDSGDPGVDHEDPNDPGSDAPDIPDFEENPIEPEDQDIPELDEDEDEPQLYEWGGEARLVAVVAGEELNGWESVAGPHGAVAIYAIEDTQMLEHGVSSVFVHWQGEFESFGPTDPHGSPAVDFGREITVIVTTEAYAEGLSDALGADAPESAVLVSSRYLAADVDGAYGVLMQGSEAVGHDIRSARAEGWVVARSEDDSLEWLVGYPSYDSAFGVFSDSEPQWDGFDGLDLGIGWEDRADWRDNAPDYALDAVETIETIEEDDGLPGEDPGAHDETPEDEEALRREEEDRAERSEPEGVHPRHRRSEREDPGSDDGRDEGSDEGDDEGDDAQGPSIDMPEADIGVGLPTR